MPKLTSSIQRSCLLSALLLLGFSGGYAQQKAERNYQYEDSTHETLDLFRKENDVEKKDYDKIIKLLDDRLAKLTNKKGYDYAMLLVFKARTYVEKGDYPKAIEPMEQSLLLSDAQTPTYLDERGSSELSYLLSNLYFQEGVSSKKPADQLASYDKAEKYILRWKNSASKLTEEHLFFYVSLLYTRATLDESKVDKERLERALELIDQCMHMSTRPKDNLYLYKMACFQQLDRTADSAEIFELLLKRKPENKDFWKQLAGTYMAMEQPVRAIVTLERAQALGLLNTPADHYSLFGIYFNEGQFEQAAELLERGFKEKTIENEEKNWELLASCYQQLNRDFKAIDALKRATQFFPKSGQLDFLIAQIYYSMKKLDDALPHLQMSVRKGAGTKPAQTHIFMAYIAYELRKLDIALEAANKAIALPDGEKEGSRFKKAVEEAIADREEKLKNQKI